MSSVIDFCPECEHNGVLEDHDICKNCFMVAEDGEDYKPCNFTIASDAHSTKYEWHDIWCKDCRVDDHIICKQCYYAPSWIIPSKFVDKFNKSQTNLNQTAKSDAGKPKLTLVPHEIIYAIARVREYGNAKYPEGGPDNWKSVEPERYRDALFRHLLLYLADPYGVDEESGLKHLDHVACNVAFVCELDKEFKKQLCKEENNEN